MIDEQLLFWEVENKWKDMPPPEQTTSVEYRELWVMARILRLQVKRFLMKEKLHD